MRAPSSTPQRRESFRCPVTESRAECVLHVGEEHVSAKLLDESAGGFLVLIDRSPDLSADPTLRLQTDSGWFDVQVIHIQETSPPEESDGAESQEQGPWFQLGLRRLGEVVPRDEIPAVRPFGRMGSRLWHHYPSNGMLTTLSALLVLGVLVLLLHWTGILWPDASLTAGGNVTRGKWWRPKIGDSRPPAQPPAPYTPNARGFEVDTARLEKTPSKTIPILDDLVRGKQGVQNDPTSAPPGFLFVSEKELQNAVRRLSGATAMILPDVVRRLQLTGAQQKQIRRIIDAAAEAMHRLDFEASRQGTQRRDISSLRAELLEQSLRDALKLFTPEQRALWEKLFAKSPAK